MSNRERSFEKRILELLADRAAFGLGAEEQQQLDALFAAHPDFDRGCMERTAATVLLAGVAEELAPLPESLRKRLRAAAPSSWDCPPLNRETP